MQLTAGAAQLGQGVRIWPLLALRRGTDQREGDRRSAWQPHSGWSALCRAPQPVQRSSIA
eukprot:3314596-Rhodomonas_salina.1